MAVPKKRTGKSAQGHRRSNWKGSVPETTKCSNCGAITLTHTVCEACGFYKGKAVSVKAADVVEEKKEIAEQVKQTSAKKAKATKVEEVVIEQPEVKVEDASTEESSEDKAE